MKCPRLVHRKQEAMGLEIAFFGDCIQEECAWWNDGSSCCELVELVHALGGIEVHLREIKDKMPHEAQFREYRR